LYAHPLAAIVSLSCNLMTGLFTEPALVEATGPILGMTVAASLDDQGQRNGAAQHCMNPTRSLRPERIVDGVLLT